MLHTVIITAPYRQFALLDSVVLLIILKVVEGRRREVNGLLRDHGLVEHGSIGSGVIVNAFLGRSRDVEVVGDGFNESVDASHRLQRARTEYDEFNRSALGCGIQ